MPIANAPFGLTRLPTCPVIDSDDAGSRIDQSDEPSVVPKKLPRVALALAGTHVDYIWSHRTRFSQSVCCLERSSQTAP
jgi:hypothetical protein